jgi:DNA modification methylase
MLEVFREVRRVMKDEGTLWLNLGDCYASGGGKVGDCPGGGEQGERWKGFRGDHLYDPKRNRKAIPVGPGTQPNRMPIPGLKPKDLVGIPWRVAFALQDDGWYLRSEIIWAKPNPMPESVTDRPTKSHEQIFLFAKSERYYYDAAAIMEPANDTGRINGIDGREEEPGARPPRSNPRTLKRIDYSKLGRNKRDVWTVNTAVYPDAHFAVFPEELIDPCVKAGCPAGGTVLDPFAGSGTTGAVARRMGAHSILIELNPEYCEMSRKRFAQELIDFVPAGPSYNIPDITGTR